MTLETLSYAEMLKLGKAHFLTIMLVELAEKDSLFPKEIGTDIKTLNQEGLYQLAKMAEEQGGEGNRDLFLEEVSSLKKTVKPKAKRKAKDLVWSPTPVDVSKLKKPVKAKPKAKVKK
jgi:hypothetical protein